MHLLLQISTLLVLRAIEADSLRITERKQQVLTPRGRVWMGQAPGLARVL